MNILFLVFRRIIIIFFILRLLQHVTGSYQCFTFWTTLSVFLRCQNWDKLGIFKILGSTIFYCHKNTFCCNIDSPLEIYLKMTQKIIHLTGNFNLKINFIASFSPKQLSTAAAWKVTKYGIFFGPYFLVFGLNTGKYGPEKIPHLDTFHAV